MNILDAFVKFKKITKYHWLGYLFLDELDGEVKIFQLGKSTSYILTVQDLQAND